MNTDVLIGLIIGIVMACMIIAIINAISNRKADRQEKLIEINRRRREAFSKRNLGEPTVRPPGRKDLTS